MAASDADSFRSPSISPSVQSRKSLPKRLTSLLFGAKASHINKFAIELDHDHKTYGPGDTVSGTVVLDVARPMGVTHVIICLYGNVEVFKNHSRPRNTPNENGRNMTGKGKRWVSEYYGDGFVSLFEEEIILCGEGRLDPNSYHFRFNLDFPSQLGLPSSIEFERGTISYRVTATVTRPAAIATTVSCERKVFYKEDINIADLSAPKAREATLQPVTRDAASSVSIRRLGTNDAKRSDESRRSSRVSTLAQVMRINTPTSINRTGSPQRESVHSLPAPSSITRSSRSSSISHAASSAAQPPAAPKSTAVENGSGGSPRHPQAIHTSVELSRSGYLPGQLANVCISVRNHNKLLRSPKGVVVTLYRLARVDMHPNLPLGNSSNGGSTKYEDYYPRSKTGLGGLSLSSAGSSQVWRKDLSQTTSPLYINPQTMSADLRLGVRVPDEAFPTIRNVPGEMMSFKYFIEVIIDIQGKLYLEEKMPSMAGMMAIAQAGEGRQPAIPEAQLQTMVFAPNCFDTTSLRRDKHAVVVQCDMIVGTRDFASRKGKGKMQAPAEASLQEPIEEHAHPGQPEMPVNAWDQRYQNGWQGDQAHPEYGSDAWGVEPGSDAYDQYYEGYDPYYEQEYYGEDYGILPPEPDYEQGGRNPARGLASSIPLPGGVDEQGLSEKERMRRHEQSLLPSQPPLENENVGETMLPSAQPSAPVLPEEYDEMPPASDAPSSAVEVEVEAESRGADITPNAERTSVPQCQTVENVAEPHLGESENVLSSMSSTSESAIQTSGQESSTAMSSRHALATNVSNSTSTDAVQSSSSAVPRTAETPSEGNSVVGHGSQLPRYER